MFRSVISGTAQTRAQESHGVYIKVHNPFIHTHNIQVMMMIFYCSYSNKFLHAAIYRFGLGSHYGQELKHM